MRGNLSKRRFIGAGVVNHGSLLALERYCRFLGVSCFPSREDVWLTSSGMAQNHAAVIVDGRAGALFAAEGCIRLSVISDVFQKHLHLPSDHSCKDAVDYSPQCAIFPIS